MPRIAATLTLLLLVTSCHSLDTVNLGDAVDFTVLGAMGVTVSGATAVQGLLGVSSVAQTYITGSASFVFSDTPTTNVRGIASVAQCVLAGTAMDIAYLDAAGRPDATLLAASSMVDVTFAPGLYKSDALTLESGEMYISGSSTDIFIFQTTTLTVNTGAKMIMQGGALAKNVFWQVGTTANFLAGSHVEGTVLAGTTIALVAGATVTGRLFSVGGQVTMLTNTVVYPN